MIDCGEAITWYSTFIGVGYRYQDVYMNIFPLFENKRDAFKLWKKTVNWWPDDKIMLTFVEAETKYWFILYCKSSVLDQSLGFVKSIPMSQNYQKFKHGVEKTAILRFGIYKTKESKARREDPDYDLELLKKSKMVYNILFQSYQHLSPHSIEYNSIKYSELYV
ncbi:MAG: hypothetical protein WCA39_08645 [Nitrososphaeraceae archaeon]